MKRLTNVITDSVIRLPNKQFKALGARAADLIMREHGHEIADRDDSSVKKMTDRLLKDVRAIGDMFKLTIYDPTKVICINDDANCVFRLFPNGTVLVSSVRS